MRSSFTLLGTLILVSLPLVVFAQITIPNDRFSNLIDMPYREVVYETNLDIGAQLQTILTATGPDQVWDFSGLNYVDSTILETTITLVDPSNPLLNDPNFSGSTHVWTDKLFPHPDAIPNDTVYSIRYGVYDGSSWTVNGAQTVADIDADMLPDTFVQWFSPPRREIIFPITDGSEWHDSTSLNQTIMGMTFTSNITIDSNWIVGWGTLITPFGTTDALRLHAKTVSQIPGMPTPDVGEEVTFLTLEGRIGASIVIEDGRAFHRKTSIAGSTTSVSNRTEGLHFALTSVYPNPTAGRIALELEALQAGTVSVEIFTLGGQLVHQLPPIPVSSGGYLISLPAVEELPAGLYQIRVSMENQMASKLVIVR